MFRRSRRVPCFSKLVAVPTYFLLDNLFALCDNMQDEAPQSRYSQETLQKPSSQIRTVGIMELSVCWVSRFLVRRHPRHHSQIVFVSDEAGTEFASVTQNGGGLLRSREPVTPTIEDRRAQRLEHAQKMLRRAAMRAKRAMTIEKRWKCRIVTLRRTVGMTTSQSNYCCSSLII